MKKNASCKAIRTNLTSQLGGFRPLSKRPLNLEQLSSKAQSPKIEFPASTKSPPDPALRKKIFSSSKQLTNNNENINTSQSPTSPQGGESNKAYDQLKSKISNLEGRLVEIKKNFELSFQKKGDKSKIGKENAETLKERQKQKLVIARGEEERDRSQKGERKRHEKTESTAARQKESKEKELPMKRTTLQLKGDKEDTMLQEYVTTFTCQSPTMLTHCLSDANLFKPQKNGKDKRTSRYYIDAVIGAFSSSNPNSFQQLCKTHLTASIDILQYIHNANRPHPKAPPQRALPPARKPTLIFDLDQTLIHCNQHATMPCDVLLPIKFPNGATVKAGINIRPYARQCLEELSKDFELIVFTASHECYANVIVDYIDPKRLISHRYFRDSCWRSEEGFYVKDLRIVDRDLKNLLLIDNAAYSYSFQLQNGVPIVPFYDNKADLQLKNLVTYMKGLGPQPNIRQRNARSMRLSEYAIMNSAQELLTRLYGADN